MQMNQTKKQPGVAPAKPGARRDWEPFWRVIAFLMLLVIAWVVWVLYQITPRSVATPLAYEHRATNALAPPQAAEIAPVTGALPPAPAPAVQAAVPEMAPAQRAAEAAAGMAMDQAQAGARAGAHQSAADVQAAALEQGRQEARAEEQAKRDGLRLATEIGTPPFEKKAKPAN